MKHVNQFFSRLTFSALLALFPVILLFADDGEVRFKMKKYTPRGTVPRKTYTAKAYSSRNTASSSKVYRSSTTPSWKKQSQATAVEKTPYSSETGDAPNEKFTQHQQITVRSFTVAPSQVDERKPFIKGNIERLDKKYTPPEKSNEYNPLLTPRQGIKEEHLNEK